MLRMSLQELEQELDANQINAGMRTWNSRHPTLLPKLSFSTTAFSVDAI
jgi:hypothetical protein